MALSVSVNVCLFSSPARPALTSLEIHFNLVFAAEQSGSTSYSMCGESDEKRNRKWREEDENIPEKIAYLSLRPASFSAGQISFSAEFHIYADGRGEILCVIY